MAEIETKVELEVNTNTENKEESEVKEEIPVADKPTEEVVEGKKLPENNSENQERIQKLIEEAFTILPNEEKSESDYQFLLNFQPEFKVQFYELNEESKIFNINELFI